VNPVNKTLSECLSGAMIYFRKILDVLKVAKTAIFVTILEEAVLYE
jgi:hypothetical protein